MEKTLQNVSQVAFFFFLVLGFLHISSSILIAQGVLTRSTWLLFNSLDLPFLFAGLAYGNAKLSLTLGNIMGNLKIPFMIITLLCGVAFITALYFNFVLPDASLV